ncbi:MAG: hypothetical protein ACYDH6_19540 [Acidimicrobiales bacterium]
MAAEAEGQRRTVAKARAGAAREHGESKAIREVIDEAVEELQLGLGELYARAQREDFEARELLTREMQQAEVDRRTADAEAHWQLNDALRHASSSDDYTLVAAQKGHEHERSARERGAAEHQRVADATRAYYEAVEAAQREYAEGLKDLQQRHAARLKEAWSAVEPETVTAADLALLSSAASALAQGLAASQG